MPDQLHADHDALRRVMRTYATLLTGDPAKVMERLPRMPFEQACQLL